MSQRESVSSRSERLWVCHACEMIGSDVEAERHVESTGHRVEQLSHETSDAVRAEWDKDIQHWDPALAASLLVMGRDRRRHVA